jgi:hypothetical protein
MIEVRGGAQPFGRDQFLHARGRHVADVRAARIELNRLAFVDFKPGRVEPFARKLHHQRQAHVPETNDSNMKLFVCDSTDEFVFHKRRRKTSEGIEECQAPCFSTIF